jgi:hypothetical protein
MTAIAIALFTLFAVYDGGATEVGIGDRRIKDIFFTEKVSVVARTEVVSVV